MAKKNHAFILSATQLWGLTLLSWHVAAPYLPPETTWSVWPYRFLPWWLGWLFALLVGLLIIPPINQIVGQPIGAMVGRLYLSPRHWPNGLIALLCGGLFYMARLQHLKWGDSYLLTIALSYPELEQRVIYNWQAPLTVLLHQRLWQYLAYPLWGWDVGQVYAAISILCGITFVFILLTFTRQLARDRLEYGLLAGLMLTTGSMQLFFGYIENYVIISLGLLITMWLSWHALHGKLPLFWPILAFAITNGFHPSTVFVWPGMLLLSWLCYRRGYLTWAEAMVQTIVPPLFIGGLIFALMEMGGHGINALIGVDKPGGGDGIWFVPLFQTVNEWQRYTMFSPAHLIDWGNIHLLISPFGLPLLLIMAYIRPTISVQAERDFIATLSLISLCYVLLTFGWNADYGGQHDWDLFAPSAWSYTLLAAFLLGRTLPNREGLRQGGLFAVAVCLLHLSAWVWTNMQPLPHS